MLQEAKYAALSDDELPMTESLACVVSRADQTKFHNVPVYSLGCICAGEALYALVERHSGPNHQVEQEAHHRRPWKHPSRARQASRRHPRGVR